jgi:hypothetical protein
MTEPETGYQHMRPYLKKVERFRVSNILPMKMPEFEYFVCVYYYYEEPG